MGYCDYSNTAAIPGPEDLSDRRRLRIFVASSVGVCSYSDHLRTHIVSKLSYEIACRAIGQPGNGCR